MTMAAATPRSYGQSTNGFAKVEQGKSYVLSVNPPSGSGEVELFAADSDTQLAPDMFSLLYTKVENPMQIPFVAVSSWVYVLAGNGSIKWLVTPANFSIAVPGASSGGGSSFDPEAPQEISGDWQFTGELIRTVKASPAANDVLNKEMGDNAYLQLATPNLQTVASDVNFQSPLGVGEPVDLNHAVSKGYSENNFVTTSTSQIITGGKTFAGAVNANGGINIPLAVGAVTDTAAVNRFYALGLAGAMSALVQPIYLNSSSITVAGSISKSSNGTLAGLTQRFSVGAASAGSNAYGSAVIPLIGPNGQFNYSSVCGFSLALNATAFAKFTFGIGRGSKTNRTGLTMDSYSMIPGDNLAVNYGEIVDVTINTPYDTVRKGYEIRVREIFYVSSVGHWQVKTTTVFLPVGHNELMPNGLNRLIYMQSGQPSIEEREEKAALYMELGGGSTNTLFKIASLRGFIAFEAGTGVSTLIIDARNEKTYALSADAGTGTRHLYANGLTNPTYHALEAMAVNAIESEETADFEDINIPL